MEGAYEDKFQKPVKTLKHAIITIVMADLVMGTDNILAVAGASKGNILLFSSVLALVYPLLCLQASHFKADG